MSSKSGEQVVLDYLQQQNRPYSATDIFNNLHKQVGKTGVVKILETLAEAGRITEKLYGKQKIYAPLQDQYGEYDEGKIKSLDTHIRELQEQVTAIQASVKSIESETADLTSQMKTEDAVARIGELESNNAALQQKLSTLESGTKLLSHDEIASIRSRKEKSVSHWRKRKRITTDILDSILEGYPKSKRELLEETGVETDESVGLDIKKFKS